MIRLLASGLLLTGSVGLAQAPVPAPRNPPASAQPADRATPEAARALAEAMSPRALMIANEQKLFREQFPAELRKQEGFAALEVQYPALIAELQREMDGPFDAYLNRMFDRLIPQIAALIGDNIPPAEVDQLTKFYLSPAGQRTLQGVVENSDTKEIVETVGQGGQADEAMLRRQLSGAASKTAKGLSDADRGAVTELMMTPGFWSLAKIQKQLLALKVETLNATDPQFEKDTEETFEKVMARVMREQQTNQ